MAKMTANQQAYALISLYEKYYTEKYGKKPSLNRHRDKWGFQDMVEDLGPDEAREIIKYYFETPRIDHPLQTLLRSYDQLARIRDERKNDEEDRLKMREETRKRVEEWERKNGNN